MNNPGVMTVETGLGPESTGIPTYSLHIGGKPAFVASLFTDNSGENAKRMAACWNACAGLDPDHLARFGLGSATGSEVYRLREQNAELLEALQLISDTDPVDCALDPQRAVRISKAAIAKAIGENK